MFYGRIINSTISNAITNVGSSAGQLSLQLLNNAPGAPAFPTILASASATPVRPDVVVFADNTQNPLVHEYDLIFERRLAANTMMSVSYVGSSGRNLPRFIDTNLPAPSGTVTYKADRRAARRPVADDAGIHRRSAERKLRPHHDISDSVSSQYNGLVLQLNRRMHDGLQVQASYTEARATDDGQSSQTFTSSNNVLNPYDLALEQGTSSFEIRHRFVATAIWNPTIPGSGAMHAVWSGFTIAPALSIDLRRSIYRHGDRQHAECRAGSPPAF